MNLTKLREFITAVKSQEYEACKGQLGRYNEHRQIIENCFLGVWCEMAVQKCLAERITLTVFQPLIKYHWHSSIHRIYDSIEAQDHLIDYFEPENVIEKERLRVLIAQAVDRNDKGVSFKDNAERFVREFKKHFNIYLYEHNTDKNETDIETNRSGNREAASV